jgi:GNAT superfamily N-acetyltransferase
MRLSSVQPTEPATAALLAAYFAERAAGFPVPGGYRPATADPNAFTPPSGVFLRLDDEEGRAVGIAGLRSLPADASGPRMEVKHLYVVPAARGRGLGRLLLDEVERRARQAGAAVLLLDTNRSLEAAGGLYRSAGFLPVEPYNDNPNATDWFAKPLR